MIASLQVAAFPLSKCHQLSSKGNNMLTNTQKHDIRETTKNAVLSALSACDIDKQETTGVYNQATDQAKLGAIEALLMLCHGNQSRAATIGGLNRSTLRTTLRRHAQ